MTQPEPRASLPNRAEILAKLPPEAVLTTREAALLCGFQTPSALRKARLEGRIRPIGRRGARGTLTWLASDLQRFMLGLAPVPTDPTNP